MGLKEPGLRGSLRNTGSVLPAFFDVTITNTNSPVQEGDILTVDYSADNTGDAQDMQDIRLEIDSVQEDVDPDVMLAGGASTTGTLEWDTTGEPEAEYTATVLSDDDSDSVMVEIGSAIPDSGIAHFDAQDGSTVLDSSDNPVSFGNSVDTWEDISGENHDLTTTSGGPTYVEEGINGNPSLLFDGVDDIMDVTYSAAQSQPNTRFVVFQWATDQEDEVHAFDFDGNDRHLMAIDVNGTFAIWSDNFLEGRSSDTEPHIWAGFWDSDNGSNSEIWIDGTQDATGDTGSNDLGGLRVGASDGGTRPANIYVGEIIELPYRVDSNDREQFFSYLSERWGISV